MILGKKIAVVLPAYNAEKTLRSTAKDLPADYVDEIILVDDSSSDLTINLALELNIKVFSHSQNFGYGRNQKTCYREALNADADIIVMVHPDYQYDPRLVLSMAGMIACGTYDVVLGSRIIGGGALKGGMPLYKYVANRMLTAFQNIMMGCKLSEYHTGYRAYSRKVLEELPLEENSDDFVFDNQTVAQIAYFGFRIGELSCPTKYFDEASSIRFARATRYGLGVLLTSFMYRLQKLGLCKFRIFNKKGKRIQRDYYHKVVAQDGNKESPL
jgi:glycosyltransferase involved in cell wall biosynthesis